MNIKKFNSGVYDEVVRQKRCTNCVGYSALTLGIIAVVWLVIDTILGFVMIGSSGDGSEYFKIQQAIVKEYGNSKFPEWYYDNCMSYVKDSSACESVENTSMTPALYYCKTCIPAEDATAKAVVGISSTGASGDVIPTRYIYEDEAQQKYQMTMSYFGTNYLQFANDYYTAKDETVVLQDWFIKATTCEADSQVTTYLCNYCDGTSTTPIAYPNNYNIPEFCEDINGIISEKTYNKLAEFIDL